MIIRPTIDAKFGGSIFNFDTSTPSVSQKIVYDSSRWSDGLSSNVETLDRMVASDESGGYWMVSVPLSSLHEGEYFPGMAINVVGEGLVIEYSQDASSWTQAENGEVILEDQLTENLSTIIRITLTDEDSWLDALVLQVYRDRIVYSTTGTDFLEYTNVSMREYLVDTGQLAAGADIKDGYIQVGPDTGNLDNSIAAVAGWFRVSDTNGTLIAFSGSSYVSVSSGSYTFAGMTAYRNGQLVTNGSQPNNQWAHYVFVPNSPATQRFNIGNRLASDDFLNVSVGSLSLFKDAPNASDLYDANLGNKKIQIQDASFSVSESTPAVDIYAYSWSIISG